MKTLADGTTVRPILWYLALEYKDDLLCQNQLVKPVLEMNYSEFVAFCKQALNHFFGHDTNIADGLVKKYIIQKQNGQAVDPNADYFVMRLDDSCDDVAHREASRKGVLAYADAIENHLPQLATDIRNKYGNPAEPCLITSINDLQNGDIVRVKERNQYLGYTDFFYSDRVFVVTDNTRHWLADKLNRGIFKDVEFISRSPNGIPIPYQITEDESQ